MAECMRTCVLPRTMYYVHDGHGHGQIEVGRLSLCKSETKGLSLPVKRIILVIDSSECTSTCTPERVRF